jgi:hypothetical protein
MMGRGNKANQSISKRLDKQSPAGSGTSGGSDSGAKASDNPSDA